MTDKKYKQKITKLRNKKQKITKAQNQKITD